ncbi:unnamed protein product [Cladocopium goreaui]|uniref:ShKT domain-containing protein n=1 Tax=Cladocopium goreaui TaxID=2562237 RepID=A0A9P1BU16_9DINO|nr:unnamed protein product [Cladocopium goreaui]|mmetsp:Transcript_13635/g.30130  ORF Transcript_13635/g.30130 Transcript_13635/m.30130 type:complete len:289 (+) Transcript_13635:93-959(+)
MKLRRTFGPLKVFAASLSLSSALEATAHRQITADGAILDRQLMRREEARRQDPECYREQDWSSAGCPVYDQTSCSSYTEQECTSGCGEGKVCLKLFMVPLSYSCCEDLETHEIFDRNAKNAVSAADKLGAGNPPPAPAPAPAKGFGSETSASALKAAEEASAGTSEATPECYRSNDWTKIACPKYDQTKCSSYSENDCSSGCGSNKVCVKLYMSPMSYSCCEDDMQQIFQRDESASVPAAPKAVSPKEEIAETAVAETPSVELPFTGTAGSQGSQLQKEAAELAQLAG